MLIFTPKSLLMLWFAGSYLNFLDNGVMTTPKRRILSFVFTVLWSEQLWRFKLSRMYMKALMAILATVRPIEALSKLIVFTKPWDFEK